MYGKTLLQKMDTYNSFEEFNSDLNAIFNDYSRQVPEGPWKTEKLLELSNT